MTLNSSDGISEGSNKPQQNPLLVATLVSSILAGSIYPTESRAWDVETWRLIWDIGQFASPVLASRCAFEKKRLPEYTAEYATAVWLSYITKAAIGSEGIWKRPNGWDTPWFYSSHTASAASWFLWALKYCDDTATKVATGVIAWATAYSRVIKDEQWRAPHTPLQVWVGFAAPFVLEFTWVNDFVTREVSKALWRPEEDVSFSAWGFNADGDVNLFQFGVKF